MKKNIMRMAAVLSAAMISVAGMAQETESVAPAPQKKYVQSFFVKAGVGSGMYYDSNDHYNGFEPIFSPMGGITWENYPTLNGWGCSITLEFTNKGSREDAENLKTEVRYSTPCISLPVRATYNWYSPKHTLRWQAGVGAFAAVNLSHKAHYDGRNYDLNTESFEDFSDIDAGLAFSFGCHIKNRCYVGFEWENGLMPICSDKGLPYTPPTSTSAHFVVGIRL